MKDRQFNSHRNEDQTIVQFDDKKFKLLEKNYKEITLNLSFMLEQFSNGKLTESMKAGHLYLSEAYITEILTAFDYKSELARKKEERFKEIRSLNEENRELRKQLGNKVSNEDVREKIKNLHSSFQYWWNVNGFGHCSEEGFTTNGSLKVQLSGMITEAYRAKNTEDETEEKKVEKLKKYGFEISESDGKYVIDSERNRELLHKLLKDKYPSVIIFDYRSYFGRKERNVLREVTIYIDNLNEL
nr:hypothetical protein [uncultured Draconibacterium sp.]